MRLSKCFLFITILVFCSQIFGQTLNESFNSTFPPEFWKIYNLDQGQFSWTKSTVRFSSAPACARIRFEGRGITNDDWLVTRKVYPIPGDNLLTFSCRSHNTHRESLEVYVSTTGNRPEDFQYLLTATGFNNLSYLEQSLSLAQFDSTPIYLAFRYIKRFGKAIYLDNIRGLEYLPKDVGVKTIIAPAHYQLNGENIYPQVKVKNYGTAEPGIFSVTLLIIDSLTGNTVYNGLQTVNNLASQDSSLVTFTNAWLAREGIYQVKAFTTLEEDMDLTNDTIFMRTQVVFSEVNDVAVTQILNPTGTLAPGTVIPQAVVANYGTSDETFSVNFDIILHNTTVYSDTQIVFLARNGSTTIDFAPWDATSDIYQSVVTATIDNDIDPTNNTLTDMFEVVTYYHDVGVTQIFNPIGELIEFTTVQPQAQVDNFGDLTENFTAKFYIAQGYEDSLAVTLNAGESRTITFSDWLPTEIGTYATKCSTALIGDEDPANDFINDSVMVVPGMGMTESNSGSALIIAPNPFGDKIMFSMKNPADYSYTIYNAAGVQVKKMKNATSWNGTDNNDNRLPKGIYFLKIESNANHLMKKIIFR